MLNKYGKKIIFSIIILNVLFTICSLYIFTYTSGVENIPLTICWFAFTGSDLVAMARIKVMEIKTDQPCEHPSKFSKMIVIIIVVLGILYAIGAQYVTMITAQYPTTLTCSFYAFLTTELVSLSHIKIKKTSVKSSNTERYDDLQGYTDLNSTPIVADEFVDTEMTLCDKKE